MRRVTIAITMVLILATAVQVSFIVDSFPGFHSNGDCSLCHNEPATAYNSSFADAQITLDGLQTEEFWSDSNYYNTMEFPIASRFGSVHGFVLLKFAQNATHLFVWVDWEDFNVTGSDLQRNEAADGIAILWNAHPGEYDMKDGWFGGMETDNPGEEIDTWIWKASAADTGAENLINTTEGSTEKITINGTVYDSMFDDGGWADEKDATQDVDAAVTWGYLGNHHEQNFGIEFARPLVTNDAGDVQFDKIGYYEFAIAIFNDTSGQNHYMSFEHQVFIYGECDENCDLGVEYVPTTIVSNVTITEVTTETESAPVNMVFVLTSLFSVVLMVRVVSRRQT